ncbi:hypothetical protein LTR53_006914 [Teratosphaeriaceae sp. CCFEE 6253]|nr:hypothetical protein LTR53_006914 [Teratosphaeriaceae sp. CCFEE 6253]
MSAPPPHLQALATRLADLQTQFDHVEEQLGILGRVSIGSDRVRTLVITATATFRDALDRFRQSAAQMTQYLQEGTSEALAAEAALKKFLRGEMVEVVARLDRQIANIEAMEERLGGIEMGLAAT